MRRRTITQLALAALAAGMVQAAAAEDAYPSKPVRIIVGYSAGGPTDLVARLVATQLQTRLGQPFIVENRAGVGSNIASEAVAAAAPDGYTLLVAAVPLTMNKYVYKNQKFDAVKSFVPITKLSSSPGVLAVRPDMAVANVQEFIALARKSPGKLSYATTGTGGSQHMATVLLQKLAGIEMLHVPYKGASAVTTDLIAGHVDAAFMTASGSMPHLQSGKVKPLAVAGPRLSGLPNVPSFAEVGMPAMVSDSWNGLLAPAGTAHAIVNKLHAATVEALRDPALRSKLEELGATVAGSASPAAFQDDIRRDAAHWAEQFKTIKIETQ